MKFLLFVYCMSMFIIPLYAEDNMELLLDLAEFYGKANQYEKAIELIQYVMENDPYNSRAKSMMQVNRSLYLKDVELKGTKKELKIIDAFETKKEPEPEKKPDKPQATAKSMAEESLEGVATKEYMAKIPFSIQVKLKELIDAGIKYSSYGKYTDAIIEFKKALDVKPDFPDAFYQIGQCYFQLRKYDLAVENLEEARKVSPNSAKIFFWLGYTKFHQGNFEESVKMYERSIELNPANVYVYLYLGNTYKLMMQFDKAEQNYKKCYELDNSNTDAYGLMTLMMLERGDLKAAYKNAERLEKEHPDNKYTYSTMAKFHYLSTNYSKALSYVQKGMEIDPNDWELLRICTLVNIELNQVDQVVLTLEKALAQVPNDFLLYDKVVDFFIKFGKYDEAMELAKRGEVYTGKHAEMHYYMGLIQEKKNNFTEAMLEYEFVIKRDEKNIDAREHLARVYTANEYYKDAIIQYEYIIKNTTHHPREAYFRDEITRLKTLIDESIREAEQSSSGGITF